MKECYNSWFYFIGDEYFDIYESCSFDKKIGKTKDGEMFESLELHLIEYIGKKADKSNGRKGQTWVKIRTENLEGFICKSAEEVIDPFIEIEEKYPVVEEFYTSQKFTARRVSSGYLIREGAKLYDKPGKDTKVLYTFTSRDFDKVIDSVEITDETDEKGHWVKVEYKNLAGWMSLADLEYQAWYSPIVFYIPENAICFLVWRL